MPMRTNLEFFEEATTRGACRVGRPAADWAGGALVFAAGIARAVGDRDMQRILEAVLDAQGDPARLAELAEMVSPAGRQETH